MDVLFLRNGDMRKTQENFLNDALGTPLFRGIGRDETAELIRLMQGEIFSFGSGQSIMEETEGEPEKHLLLLLSGMVQLVRYSEKGVRYMIDYTLPGDVIGYTDVYGGAHNHRCFYIAGRRSILLRLKPYEGDDAALLTFNNNLLGIISNKNESLIRKVDITSHRSVRGKILLYLAYESREKGKSFNIPLNRQELADYICVDRTTLSSTLSTLQKEGLIKTEKAHFELYANIGEG